MQTRNTTVSVIGLGYIGLPTAAVLASKKVRVIGIDINPHIVDRINKGLIHFAEPELDIAVHAAVMEKYLRASTVCEPADAFLIAVPTPFNEDHAPDLSYVEAAARSIAPVLKKGDLVVLESTSPVGTTERIAEWLAAERPDLSFPQQKGERSDIRLAHSPERVLPGHVMRELIENDRVIGGMTTKCSEAATALYKIFVKGECVVTDMRTAEMCKLTENAFRDVSIAFANELSLICHATGINVWELIELANRHPRVNILQPGPGVGGHCIAVDPWFIVNRTPQEARLIRMAREVNDGKPGWVLARVDEAIAEFKKTSTDKPTVAVLGLTFKPNIEDMRESPALAIAQALAAYDHIDLAVVEPNVEELPATLATAQFMAVDEALQKADIIVILVAHRQFARIANKLHRRQLLVDTVGMVR